VSSVRISLAGLVAGIVGLVVQWIADPVRFPGFPPGIAFIVVCGVLMVVLRRFWWAPVFAVLIALWIDLGGWAAGQMTPNFTSGNAGTVVGTAVMALGLAVAAVTGIVAMVAARRARAR